MTDHEDPALLAAGYTHGALTPEETAVYEEYLAASADARRDAAEFNAAAAALGFDATPVTPSASLKERIMAQLTSTPQLPALSAAEPTPVVPVAAAVQSAAAASVAPTTEPAVPSPAGLVESRARSRWSRRPAAVLVAAAAAIVLVAGGTVLGSALGGTNSFAQQQAVALAQINAAPDMERATATVAGGGTATLVWSGGLGRSALFIDGLEQLPSDKTYELWYLSDGGATPAGTVEAVGDGPTWRVLDGDMKSGDVIGVTVEPSGGSKTPTSTPIVTIKS